MSDLTKQQKKNYWRCICGQNALKFLQPEQNYVRVMANILMNGMMMILAFVEEEEEEMMKDWTRTQ